MSARAVDYISINVAADPDGLTQLRELGVRTVPVVAKGKDYVMGCPCGTSAHSLA